MRPTPCTHKPRSQDRRKETTIVALARVIDPLVDLMFDAGITVREFTKLVRERAVRRAARRVAKEGGRTSKSRVSIVTGLPRSEVARILGADDLSIESRLGQHPARKVLAAWYDNPRFLCVNGDPAVLPIFGKRRSFERLVAISSGGIPVRAMLDQLAQINAVEVLSGQRVKAKSRVPIFTGLTSSAIAIIGERAGDLLQTLKSNLHATRAPLFEGTALLADIEPAAIPLVRREIAEQGAAFLDGANSLLARARAKLRRPMLAEPPKCRVGVTIYYFQDEPANQVSRKSVIGSSRRKNLQRQPKSAKRSVKTKGIGHVVTSRQS
jgi:Family of unknown function (DUF6502)